MSEECDVAMPRAQPGCALPQVCWWSPELTTLRKACVAARRRYTRHRRLRIRPPDTEAIQAELYEAYRAAKNALKVEILRAKGLAGEESLDTPEQRPEETPLQKDTV